MSVKRPKDEIVWSDWHLRKVPMAVRPVPRPRMTNEVNYGFEMV
jgi:hypothetical protein